MNKFRTIHARRLLAIVIVLASMISLVQVSSVSGAKANASPTATPFAFTPVPHDKNGAQSESAFGGGSFSLLPPQPFSKNDGAHSAIGDSSGGTFELFPDPGSKNYAEQSQATLLPGDLAAALSADGAVLNCVSSANASWTSNSGSFEVIRQCGIVIPEAGWVFISANGSLGPQDGEYEALFQIGIDGTGDSNIDRWVNVYNDSGDGADETVALSGLEPVTAGAHTFEFLGRRAGGAGTVLVYDPSLSVIFIPAANSQILACGASGNLDWTTTSSSLVGIRQCSLSLPQAGWVFLSADASLARQGGEFEALFEIGMDGTGNSDTDRWVNVYNDSGDGTDKSVALSALMPVSAGTHTFDFLGSRYGGAGTALAYDPTLTAIFIPAANSQVLACGDSGNLDWTTTSSSFVVIRQCTIQVPQAGWVFLSATGSLARQDGEYEAQFRLGIDQTTGLTNTDRWVNVYNDSGDGTDKSVALSALMSVAAGTHTFYFLGSRFGGAGTVVVYDPSLSVLAQGARIYLPLIIKGP